MGEGFKTTFSTETEKTRFVSDFEMVLGTIWDHVGDLWVPRSSSFPVFSVFFRIGSCIDFLIDFGTPGTHFW